MLSFVWYPCTKKHFKPVTLNGGDNAVPPGGDGMVPRDDELNFDGVGGMSKFWAISKLCYCTIFLL